MDDLIHYTVYTQRAGRLFTSLIRGASFALMSPFLTSEETIKMTSNLALSPLGCLYRIVEGGERVVNGLFNGQTDDNGLNNECDNG